MEGSEQQGKKEVTGEWVEEREDEGDLVGKQREEEASRMLFALSAAIRSHTAAQQWFLRSGGMELLAGILTRDNQPTRLVRKVLFLIADMAEYSLEGSTGGDRDGDAKQGGGSTKGGNGEKGRGKVRDGREGRGDEEGAPQVLALGGPMPVDSGLGSGHSNREIGQDSISGGERRSLRQDAEGGASSRAETTFGAPGSSIADFKGSGSGHLEPKAAAVAAEGPATMEDREEEEAGVEEYEQGSDRVAGEHERRQEAAGASSIGGGSVHGEAASGGSGDSSLPVGEWLRSEELLCAVVQLLQRQAGVIAGLKEGGEGGVAQLTEILDVVEKVSSLKAHVHGW